MYWFSMLLLLFQESLLKKYFAKLRLNGEEVDQDNPAPEHLNKFEANKQIHYVWQLDDLLYQLSRFRQDIETGLENTEIFGVNKILFDVTVKIALFLRRIPITGTH